MYAYPITEAFRPSTLSKASILPSLDVSSVVHWYEPNGTTRTGCLQSLELIDGTWWGAALYELIPGNWVLENRHAFNFFAGVGQEFPLQLGQRIWFNRGNSKWQSAAIADFYLESNIWFVVVSFRSWFGICHDELPMGEISLTEPKQEDEDTRLESKADFWADYRYEDWRDSR